MGKKYDAWQEARQESKDAEASLQVHRGGSTQVALTNAILDREDAAMSEYVTYAEYRADPEG